MVFIFYFILLLSLREFRRPICLELGPSRQWRHEPGSHRRCVQFHFLAKHFRIHPCNRNCTCVRVAQCIPTMRCQNHAKMEPISNNISSQIYQNGIPNPPRMKENGANIASKRARGVPKKPWKNRSRKKTHAGGIPHATLEQKYELGVILAAILAPRGSCWVAKILIF